MEGKEFKFIGPPDKNDPKREKANVFLEDHYLHGLEKEEGELEKTETQREAIRTVNQIISQIFDYYNIKGFESIEEDRVHFLNKDNFEKSFSERESGTYRSMFHAVYMNTERFERNNAYLLSILLHECLHAASCKKFYFNVDDEGNEKAANPQVGYRINVEWKNGEELFLGLNEFIVCIIQAQALRKFKSTLEQRFGITEHELNGPIYSEGIIHSDFINKILLRMKDGEIDVSSFMNSVVKGHFSGSVIALKPLEDFFGRGSIKVLSYLGGSGTPEKNALVEEYFLKASEERKQEIKDELKRIGREK